MGDARGGYVRVNAAARHRSLDVPRNHENSSAKRVEMRDGNLARIIARTTASLTHSRCAFSRQPTAINNIPLLPGDTRIR